MQLKVLCEKERNEKGLRGGIVRLALIMALVVPEGFQVTYRGETKDLEAWMMSDMDVSHLASFIVLLPAWRTILSTYVLAL